MYAPLYRQSSIGGGDITLATGDVEAAFRHYAEHLNHGRKFVLMGHSQGTLVLTPLELAPVTTHVLPLIFPCAALMATL